MLKEPEPFRGFFPCDEPLTWNEIKVLVDEGTRDLAAAGIVMTSITSIAFVENRIPVETVEVQEHEDDGPSEVPTSFKVVRGIQVDALAIKRAAGPVGA